MGIEWRTERRNVADLKDFPNNPRTFTEKGMADLKASLKSLGYIDPIAINLDGTIIGGHARRKTLLDLGLKEVDVRVPDQQLTDKQVEEAIIRLNRNTAGQWDFKILEDSFQQAELVDWGFDKSEFNAFAKPQAGDPETIPEAPVTPRSVLGDIWVLGNHRIACGSATDASAVAALLAGAQPMLMVTDPPYGVNYDPEWRHRLGINKSLTTGKVMNDDIADWTEAWALFPGNVAYVWHGGLHAHTVGDSLIKTGFLLKGQIIWAKRSLVMSRGNYHWQHEPCWYAVRDGEKHNWHGGRKQSTLWDIENMHATMGSVDDGKTNHSTQKPVECMKRPIENNSQPGDGVYEPFSGSGTTIIAAEITGRSCFAMELNPSYVDMAVLRWQNYTGMKAVHAATGKPFDDIGEANNMISPPEILHQMRKKKKRSA
jgi:DNA modification methylase